MNYDFSIIKSEGERVKDRFKQEIAALSAYRANPAMVENLLVDLYGAKNAVKTFGGDKR